MEADATRARRSADSNKGWQSVEFRCVITLPDKEYTGYFVNDRNFRRAKFLLPKISRKYQTWCRPDETFTEIVTETKRQYPMYDSDEQLITHAVSGACVPNDSEDRTEKRIRYPLELDIPNIQRHLVKLELHLSSAAADTTAKTVCGDVNLPRWKRHGQRSTRPNSRLKVNLVPQLSDPSVSYTFGIAEPSKPSESHIVPEVRKADPTEFETFLDDTLKGTIEDTALHYNSLFNTLPEEDDWIEAETSHLVNFMSLVSTPPAQSDPWQSYVVQRQVGPTAQLELNIHGKRTRADDNAEVFDNLESRPESLLSWDDAALQDGSRLRACVGMQSAFSASSLSHIQDVSLAIEFETLP